MSADPRAALSFLTAALERHLEVATNRQDPDDPAVVAAAQSLADAFDDYDDALFRATEVATPLAVYDGDDEDYEGDDDYDDDEELDELDDEDDGVYAGLDDEESDDDSEDEGDDAAGGRGRRPAGTR